MSSVVKFESFSLNMVDEDKFLSFGLGFADTNSMSESVDTSANCSGLTWTVPRRVAAVINWVLDILLALSNNFLQLSY